MAGHVVPRHALGVGGGQVPAEVAPARRHPAAVIRFARVQVTDQRVVTGLTDGRCAAKCLANRVECSTPVRGAFDLRVEAAPAIIVIHRRHRAEHVHEVSGRREALLDEFQVAIQPGSKRLRQPAVALRVAASVEPRLLRRAVGIEDDVPIGIAVGIGIEINVVVVRREEDAVALAGVRHREEVGQAAARREDVRQAVVIAPSLPGVLDEDGVGHAVARRAVESPRGRGVVAAPLVEAHLALELCHAAGRLEAGYLAVGAAPPRTRRGPRAPARSSHRGGCARNRSFSPGSRRTGRGRHRSPGPAPGRPQSPRRRAAWRAENRSRTSSKRPGFSITLPKPA